MGIKHNKTKLDWVYEVLEDYTDEYHKSSVKKGDFILCIQPTDGYDNAFYTIINDDDTLSDNYFEAKDWSIKRLPIYSRRASLLKTEVDRVKLIMNNYTDSLIKEIFHLTK